VNAYLGGDEFQGLRAPAKSPAFAWACAISEQAPKLSNRPVIRSSSSMREADLRAPSTSPARARAEATIRRAWNLGCRSIEYSSTRPDRTGIIPEAQSASPGMSSTARGRTRPGSSRRFFQAYEQRKSTEVKHPTFGYRMSYGRMLEVQARMLAAYLRGDIPRYVGFTVR